MDSTSFIELSEKALQNNLAFIRQLIGDKVILSSVVKGNAYGHGLEEYVRLAFKNGVNHFSVYSADEAKKIYDTLGDEPEIMIMGWISDEDLPWVINHGIQFFVFDADRLSFAHTLAKRLEKKALVHIELETGFNRTGISSAEIKKAKRLLHEHQDTIEFTGLCTHLAGAESVANHVRVSNQIKRYRQALQSFERSGLKPKIRHAACSAATISYPKVRFDLVRIGILQYGFWPSTETFIQFLSKQNKDAERIDPLKRIISWKSYVMTVKAVKEGEFIGYGTSFLARKEMRIVVIPVGYSHGFSRTLSNQGRVVINGQRVGVVGLVNMNCLVADASMLPDVQIGDEVTLIGTEQDAEVTVASFSEISEQLNYELLTRLPRNIPRKITH